MKNLLIKLVEPGWETYTGDLGMVPFEQGVSLRPISSFEALALGAHIKVVEIDSLGRELGLVSPGLDTIIAARVPADVEKPIVYLSDVIAEREAAEKAADSSDAPDPDTRYTRAELEDIATAKGISGIREIAEPLGVKGTSIRGLINDILLIREKVER